jgi:hypothetical protein
MEAVLRENPRLWMLVLYLFMTSAFLYIRPAVAFEKDGKARAFGVGRTATIYPVWVWMWGFAVVAYLVVIYCLDFQL